MSVFLISIKLSLKELIPDKKLLKKKIDWFNQCFGKLA